MMDNDDINRLLQSLPQQQAPADLEPSVMRRIRNMRRRRGLFGVHHTAKKSGWIGGAVIAALAGVLVAGGALVLQNREHQAVERPSTDTLRDPLREAPTGHGPNSGGSAEVTSTDASVDLRRERQIRAARSHVNAAPARRHTASSNGTRHRAVSKAEEILSRPIPMDTVAAARMRPRTPVALPGANLVIDAVETTATDSQDEPSGVGTGAR